MTYTLAEDRPKFVTQEHLDYLDELCKTGDTNMCGAAPYLMREFSDVVDLENSRNIITYWMLTFGKASR